MNGSDLESENGSATKDLDEMTAAYYDDNVNVIVETIGTRQWSGKYGIASDHAQRYKVGHEELTLVDDSLGQLRVADPDNLLDFIQWGAANYPADRYMLVLWDHGGGPIYGYGNDENATSDEYSSMDVWEIYDAVSNCGVHFDFIGFDACIMSSIEIAYMMRGFTDYMLLSEDFESSLGWYYSGWITALSGNSDMDMAELGCIIVDDMARDNADNWLYGGSGTLALIDESQMDSLFNAWTAFAYANTDTLLETNFSTEYESKDRSTISDLQGYSITDMMALADNIDTDESAALSTAYDNAVVYYNHTDDVEGLTGMAVTLPYDNNDSYISLAYTLQHTGTDESYIEWLGQFVNAEGTNAYYDYTAWIEELSQEAA